MVSLPAGGQGFLLATPFTPRLSGREWREQGEKRPAPGWVHDDRSAQCLLDLESGEHSDVQPLHPEQRRRWL